MNLNRKIQKTSEDPLQSSDQTLKDPLSNESEEQTTSVLSSSSVQSFLKPSTSSTSKEVHGMTFQNDIAVFIGKVVDDHTKCRLLESPWQPTDDYEFPFSIHVKSGKEERRFVSRGHLAKYPWLIISPSEKGLFCKYCTLFATGHVGGFQKNVALQKLVVKPLQSFAKLLGKDGALETHTKNVYHQQAMQAGKLFLEAYHNPNKDVINQINEQRLSQVNENRARLKPIIHTIIFLGRQNIAFRGDRDDGELVMPRTSETELSPINEGNFRELLRFRIQAGDKSLEKHLTTANARATYISKTTQNELIECIGEEILSTILSKVDKSKFYSVIFDETTDVSHVSQLSIVLRYVTDRGVKEDFIQFADAYKAIQEKSDNQGEPILTGSALGQLVLDTLKQLNLDLKHCVGIGTDGCSVMVSEVCGAVAEMQKEAKNAVRCPCYSHALNLSLSKSSSLQCVRNATGIMKETVSFFTASAKRNSVLKSVLGTQVSGVCETRWVERHTTILQFRANLSKIVDALHMISEWREIESASKAKSLIAALCSSDFIVTIVCISEVLSLTLPLSRYLQKESVTVDKAGSLVQDTLKTLKEKRGNSEEEFCTLFEKCNSTASSLDIEVTVPRLAKRQQHRSNHPTSNQSNPEEYYRISLYIPLLESVTEDLRTRFSEETLWLYGLTMFIPAQMMKEDFQDIETKNRITLTLKKVAKKFHPLLNVAESIVEQIVSSEYHLWRRKWERDREGILPKNALATLDVCDADIFPLIKNMLHILATLPASVASAERSFSTLRRLKTWIRSRMGEERLVGLALLNIHRDIKVEIDKVIDRFSKKFKRRLEFIV